MITVSASAKDYLNRLMAEEKREEGTFIRVGVKGGGCSGLEYNLHFDSERKAGDELAIYLRVASPEVFGFGTLSLALSMVLIGGVNTVFGPVLAALVLTFATEAMAGLQGFEDARFIVIAVAMILVLRLAPEGLVDLLGKLRLPVGTTRT